MNCRAGTPGSGSGGPRTTSPPEAPAPSGCVTAWVGDLDLDWNAVTWAADPDLRIIVWTAEPGTPSHDALRLLAAWAADPTHAADGSRG